MEISYTLLFPNITDWWRQQDETHWNYIDLAYVACGIFSIMLHCVWAEARISLARDYIGWR
jgi:hypothetical protein